MIRKKVLLSALISVVLAVMCVFAVSKMLIIGYIENEESNIIYQNYQRAISILQKEEAVFERTVLDWAHWDDTYSFITDRNTEYIESNLQEAALAPLKLNFMIFADKGYRVVYANTTKLSVKSEDMFIEDILSHVKSKHFFKGISDNKPINGITILGGNPMFISLSPVTNTEGTASINGFLIVGSYVDQAFISYMEDVLQVKIHMTAPLNLEAIAPRGLNRQKAAFMGENIRTEKNNASLKSHVEIDDILNDQSIPFELSMERGFYKNGIKAIHYFGVISVAALLIVAGLCICVFDRLVTRRIGTLNAFVSKVTASRDTTSRITVRRKDEISSLAANMNNMLGELGKSYAENLYLMQTDPITTLKNRSYMEDILKKADQNKGCNSWLIMGDVNGLKIVNDSLGHQKGDRLLRDIGEIFKRNCSESDIPARWGGDEFLILVRNRDAAYVENLIQRIKTECEQAVNYPFKISIAMGSAGKDEKHPVFDAVLKLVEERMYRNKLLESRSARSAIIFSLEQSLHEKHIETEEHTKRIKHMCIQIGNSLGLSQEELDELALLGVLHDIGKIAIPETVLLKPGELTDEEWEVMKTHAEIGYRIAASTPELAHIADEILYHHERYDGTGYPQGLAGKDIPKLSRLLAIVDSFDAMTHDRVYKKAMSLENAVHELRYCSGTQFDPEMVRAFLKLLEEHSFDIAKINNEGECL